MLRLAGVHLLLGALGLAARAARVHKRALKVFHLHVIPHIRLPHVAELIAQAAYKPTTAAGGGCCLVNGRGVTQHKLQQVPWVSETPTA